MLAKFVSVRYGWIYRILEKEMLLVKTNVKASAISGMGLFADDAIQEGETVWQYTSQTCSLITNDQLNVFLQSYHKTEEKIIQYYLIYGYYSAQVHGLILCLDNGRFVNHSEQPNLTYPLHISKDHAWKYSVAKREIQKGEELTEDYRTYDTNDWLKNLCEQYHIFHY